MTNPFQPDRIPEPRWLTHGPDDPPEPPDNYLPDEERAALRELADFLDGDLEEVEAMFMSGTSSAPSLPNKVREAPEAAYAAWKAATEKLLSEVHYLIDETVGDDWNY